MRQIFTILCLLTILLLTSCAGSSYHKTATTEVRTTTPAHNANNIFN